MDETSSNNRNEDIDSKIADFMADIDEIMLGKKSNSQSQSDQSEWKECFDESSQSVYYWNTKTNECTWDPPQLSKISTNRDKSKAKRQSQTNDQQESPKKLKKVNLIAQYTSSESESTDNEQTADDIDELLEEVLEEKATKQKKTNPVDNFPLFEADCRAAIARLCHLDEKNKEALILRIQLETRLEDVLTGHLPKSYAAKKLEDSIEKIDELEKVHFTSNSTSSISKPVETTKSNISTNEVALLLSLPPPPPPDSPPPAATSSTIDDPALQMFYAEINSNSDDVASPSTLSENVHEEKNREKKIKTSKPIPTSIIHNWTFARQQLPGIGDHNDS